MVVAILLLASAAGITGISGVDSDPSALTQSQSRANILQPGRILHGMHPGGGDGQEDIIIDKPGVCPTRRMQLFTFSYNSPNVSIF